jgi:hypothetical protein
VTAHRPRSGRRGEWATRSTIAPHDRDDVLTSAVPLSGRWWQGCRRRCSPSRGEPGLGGGRLRPTSDWPPSALTVPIAFRVMSRPRMVPWRSTSVVRTGAGSQPSGSQSWAWPALSSRSGSASSTLGKWSQPPAAARTTQPATRVRKYRVVLEVGGRRVWSVLAGAVGHVEAPRSPGRTADGPRSGREDSSFVTDARIRSEPVFPERPTRERVERSDTMPGWDAGCARGHSGVGGVSAQAPPSMTRAPMGWGVVPEVDELHGLLLGAFPGGGVGDVHRVADRAPVVLDEDGVERHSVSSREGCWSRWG